MTRLAALKQKSRTPLSGEGHSSQNLEAGIPDTRAEAQLHLPSLRLRQLARADGAIPGNTVRVHRAELRSEAHAAHDGVQVEGLLWIEMDLLPRAALAGALEVPAELLLQEFHG